jgi:hypothetical protein
VPGRPSSGACGFHKYVFYMGKTQQCFDKMESQRKDLSQGVFG